MIAQSRRDLLAIFSAASAASILPKSTALAAHGALPVPDFNETAEFLGSREGIDRLILDLSRVWRFSSLAFLNQHQENSEAVAQAQQEAENFRERPPISHVFALQGDESRQALMETLNSLSQDQEDSIIRGSRSAHYVSEFLQEYLLSELDMNLDGAEDVDALQSIVHADRTERLVTGNGYESESAWCRNLYFRWICRLLG